MDTINFICELAAGLDLKWYPHFDVKTNRLTWKVNQYNKHNKRMAKRIGHIDRSHNVFAEGRLSLSMYMLSGWEYEIEPRYRSILFRKGCHHRICLSFDWNTEDGVRTFYAMLTYFKHCGSGDYVLEDKSHIGQPNQIFLDGEYFAPIKDAYFIDGGIRLEISCFYETYYDWKHKQKLR